MLTRIASLLQDEYLAAISIAMPATDLPKKVKPPAKALDATALLEHTTFSIEMLCLAIGHGGARLAPAC